MFESLKTLWKKENQPRRIMTNSPRQLAGKLPGWKASYRATRNGEAQKALMLIYNRALSVYAKSHTHREEIDALLCALMSYVTLFAVIYRK